MSMDLNTGVQSDLVGSARSLGYLGEVRWPQLSQNEIKRSASLKEQDIWISLKETG